MLFWPRPKPRSEFLKLAEADGCFFGLGRSLVPDFGCPQDSPALIWSIFGSILPNHLNMIKTVLEGALLVATSLLNTYKVFIKIG